MPVNSIWNSSDTTLIDETTGLTLDLDSMHYTKPVIAYASLLRIVRKMASERFDKHVTRSQLMELIEIIDISLLLRSPDPDIPVLKLANTSAKNLRLRFQLAEDQETFTHNYGRALVFWKAHIQRFLEGTEGYVFRLQ